MGKSPQAVLISLRKFLISQKQNLNSSPAGEIDIIIKGSGTNSMPDGLEQLQGSTRRIYLDLISSTPLGNSLYSKDSENNKVKVASTLWNHTIQIQLWYNPLGEENASSNWAMETCFLLRELFRLRTKDFFFDQEDLSLYINDNYTPSNISYNVGSQPISVMMFDIDVRCIFSFQENIEVIETFDWDLNREI